MQLLKHFGAIRRRWNPELLFTGISVMQINPQTGDDCRAQDTTMRKSFKSAGCPRRRLQMSPSSMNRTSWYAHTQGASAAASTTGMRSRTEATPALQRSGTWLRRCLAPRTRQTAVHRRSTPCFGALLTVRSEGTGRDATTCMLAQAAFLAPSKVVSLHRRSYKLRHVHSDAGTSSRPWQEMSAMLPGGPSLSMLRCRNWKQGISSYHHRHHPSSSEIVMGLEDAQHHGVDLQVAHTGVPGVPPQPLSGHFAAMTFRGTADDATVTKPDMRVLILITFQLSPAYGRMHPHASTQQAQHGMCTAPTVQVSRQVQLLRRAVAMHGLCAQGPDYLLAEREQASTRPALRRNDVLVQLHSFELW